MWLSSTHGATLTVMAPGPPVNAPDGRFLRLRYRVAMTTTHTFFPNLAAEAPVPARGIHSQTLSSEAGVELVLFAFAAGEQLSEHTSARPAIIHILSGEGDLTVGDDAFAAVPGAWLRMPANTRHGVVARTPLVMALYLLSPGH
jgi:quercetin dioxygenase-like cupin family protein